MTARFLLRPACQAFGDDVQIGDMTREVGAHDRVPYRVERDLGTLLLDIQRLGIYGALDHARQRLGQQVGVETSFKEIILSATLYGQLGRLLVLGIGQDQDRNLRRREKQAVERLYAENFSKEKINHNRPAAPH